ncbi:unnamed protein product [Ectocarpus sp. 12 AP-2014]
MSPPYRLPQWPPRSSAPQHFKPRRRGDYYDNGSDPSHQLDDDDATTLVTDGRDSRQQQQCRPADDLADESFLGVPIFRGDVVLDTEEDGGGSNLELSLLDDDHAAAASTTMPGGERASPRWSSGNRAEQRATTTEPVVSVGPAVSSSTPLRVRFAPDAGDGGTALLEAAEASPSPPRPPAARTDRRGEEKEDISASGSSCFVRHRNGMHTAWRRKAAVPDNPRQPLQATVAAARAEPPNGAVGGNNNNTSSRRDPVAPIRREGVMSADQLIAQSMSSTQQQQQQPVRLFLRRSRPLVSPEPAGKENVRAAVVLREAKGGVAGARRVNGSQQAFPLPWGGTHSPVTGVQLNRTRPDGGGWGGREALLEVLTTPPPPRACPRSAQHVAHSPPLTSRTSPGTSTRRAVVVVDDENTPPPRRRTPSTPAVAAAVAAATPLSSVAIRKNLARVARTSKVGTKADPVHLYRQRQELEQVRTKKAAAVARSRRKPTSREGRPTGGCSAWGTGTAGGWVGVNSGGGGGRVGDGGGGGGGSRVGLR